MKSFILMRWPQRIALLLFLFASEGQADWLALAPTVGAPRAAAEPARPADEASDTADKRDADAPRPPAAALSKPAGPGGRGRGGPVSVTLAPVVVAPYTDTFRSIGVARAHANVTVRNEVAGTVTQLHFRANQQVEAGAPLVSLDDRREQIALTSVRVSLAELEASLKRYRTLYNNRSGAVSEVTVIEAENQVKIAQTAVEQAQYDLAQKTVRAPVGGTLGLSDIEQGSYLAASTDIVRIVDHTHLTIEFGLPDRAARQLKQGQPVRLITSSLSGRVFEGVVEGYDPLVDPTTQTIKVRAGIDNATGQLLPGMVFNVMLSEVNAPLPRVPAMAITWSRAGAAVWVARGDQVSRRLVEIRYRDRDQVWLQGTLDAGERVVVEGVQKLREGSRIRPVEGASTPPAVRSGAAP